MPALLTAKSPRTEVVPHALIQLKPHQQAIVRCCMDIEARVYKSLGKTESDELPYAVMGAPVGCGKTFCILSMCLLDKFTQRKASFWDFFSFKKHVTGATLVVVPSHLFHQWDTAITVFAGSDLVVHRFNGYPDVMKLNDIVSNVASGNTEAIAKLRTSDVFLVSSLYYQSVATTLLTADVTFRRLVFDEADSMRGMISYASPATITWFVSASIRSIVGEDGGLRIGSDRDGADAYHVPTAALEKNFVDCSVEFIERSFALPTVAFEKHVCADGDVNRAVACMAGLFDEATRQALYACDTSTAEIALLGKLSSTQVDEIGFMVIVRDGWRSKLDEVRQHAEEKRAQDDYPMKAVDLRKLTDEAVRLEANLGALDALGAVTSKSNLTSFSKVDTVMQMIRDGGGRKTLVFTHFPRVLYALQRLLDQEKIKHVDFEAGSQDAVAKSIKAYTTDDKVNVLLAHSAMFSCGTNLECTQHIIFMHHIPDAIRSQVIGRGQRPGRVGPLLVTDMLYAGEADMA
jgi:hypothetical protein